MIIKPELTVMPPPPAALPDATYAARMSAWWQQCDVVLRSNDQLLRVWQVMVNEELSVQSTAAQNARALAEERVATAGSAAAASQQAAASAFNLPPPLPSDNDLLLRFFMNRLNTPGTTATAAMSGAKLDLTSFKIATAKIPGAPR